MFIGSGRCLCYAGVDLVAGSLLHVLVAVMGV